MKCYVTRFRNKYCLNQTVAVQEIHIEINEEVLSLLYFIAKYRPWRRDGLVVKRRIPERDVRGSILTQVAALYL